MTVTYTNLRMYKLVVMYIDQLYNKVVHCAIEGMDEIDRRWQANNLLLCSLLPYMYFAQILHSTRLYICISVYFKFYYYLHYTQ